MSIEAGFESDMSRRDFGRAVMLGGAMLLGGATLLEGEGSPSINGPAGGDLRQAVRLETPQPHVDPSTQNIRELYNPGGLYRRFEINGQKLVTLTYDDGPWPVNTRAIMDTLAKNGLEGCATFFQVADNVKQFQDIGKEVVQRGYLVANHSKTHSTYVPSRIAAEIPIAQDMIYELLGIRPDLFRSPGLTEGQVIQDVLYQLGMCNIFTDTDPHDWAMPRLTSEQIIGNVNNQLHPGLVLLLHDGGSHTPTVNATQGIIDVIRAKGFTIVTMKQMMQAAAGAILTNNRVERYEIPRNTPDYSGDTFNRTAELEAIGLVAA